MWRYVILGLLIYFIFRAVRRFFKFKNAFTVQSENCPACQSVIRVSGDNMVCPKCGVKLGRNTQGKLLIRVN
jgi:hypothetical protein